MGRFDGLITGKTARIPTLAECKALMELRGPSPFELIPSDELRQSSVPGAIEKKSFRKKHTPGKMNRWEAAYADILTLEKAAGNIIEWAYEPIKFRFADRTFYEIDFIVKKNDGTLMAIEVKGHWEDDARVKFKIARENFGWMFEFVAITKTEDGFERID